MKVLYLMQRLLRLKRVCDVVTLSKTSIYDRLARGEFPQPVRIGNRNVAWREADIVAWIDGLPTRDPRLSATRCTAGRGGQVISRTGGPPPHEHSAKRSKRRD